MKKLIGLIVLMSGLAVTAQAEIKTGILTSQNKTAEVEIKEGDTAEVLFFTNWYYRSQSAIAYFEQEGIKAPIIKHQIRSDSNNGGGSGDASNLKFAGPGKLIFEHVSGNPGPDYYSVYSVEVLPSSYVGGKSSGNNVTVIPDSAENATLVLEGSDDMVNWTVETLGDKPKGNRKKFYRLRAVKE